MYKYKPMAHYLQDTVFTLSRLPLESFHGDCDSNLFWENDDNLKKTPDSHFSLLLAISNKVGVG